MAESSPWPEAHPRATIADGDSLVAWVEVSYRQFGPPVLRYLLRRTGDPTAAEDLAQEVFLRLFQEASAGAGIRDVRLWAFRVAHNLAVDWFRRRNLEDDWRAQAAALHSAPDASIERQLLAGERDRKVEQAMAILSPQERQCMELRAEGLRHREIAELMNLQVSTVGTFLARAIRKIARQIDA